MYLPVQFKRKEEKKRKEKFHSIVLPSSEMECWMGVGVGRKYRCVVAQKWLLEIYGSYCLRKPCQSRDSEEENGS